MFQIIPNAYPMEPWKWVTNQTAHFGAGIASAVLICFVWLYVSGEFPYRSSVFAFLVLFYGGYIELFKQGWQGGDTVEDITFFVVYGAGPILYAFQEVNAGSGGFAGNIMDITFFVIAFPMHLALGVGFRVLNRARGRNEQ